MYSPREGRFLSLDPLAAKYPSISPYAFVANSPIQALDPDGREIVWHVKFQKSNQFKPIIVALNKTDVYNTIFTRFIKNQDNVFINPVNETHFGYANPNRKSNGYDLDLGYNGFLKNGYLIADATFISKVIMHEGLHHRYEMAIVEGKQSDYPTLNKHLNRQATTIGYEGEHETMSEMIPYLVKGMKQFDAAYGTQHSEDWYNAMAWFGSLSRTDAWKNMDVNQKSKYETIIKNEIAYMNYLDAQAIYKKDKTSVNKRNMNNAKSNVDWKLFNKTRKK